MSGTSSDNDISLREHMQRQLDTQRHYFERLIGETKAQLDERAEHQAAAFHAAIVAAEKAVAKAEAANDKRFDASNHYRSQLTEQATTMMPRSESIQRHDAAVARTIDLEKRVTESMASINSRLDRSQGNSAGVDKAWGYLLGVVGLAGGVIGIIISIN